MQNVVGVASFYFADDKSALSIFLLDGPGIDADISSDTWEIHTE